MLNATQAHPNIKSILLSCFFPFFNCLNKFQRVLSLDRAQYTKFYDRYFSCIQIKNTVVLLCALWILLSLSLSPCSVSPCIYAAASFMFLQPHTHFMFSERACIVIYYVYFFPLLSSNHASHCNIYCFAFQKHCRQVSENLWKLKLLPWL